MLWAHQMMDLGSVHERSTAIFTITLAQYAPAAVHEEEDRVMVRGAGQPAWLDWAAMHPCLPAQSAVHLGSTLAPTCAPSPSRNKAQGRVSCVLSVVVVSCAAYVHAHRPPG